MRAYGRPFEEFGVTIVVNKIKNEEDKYRIVAGKMNPVQSREPESAK